jgi:hypothetical protein
VISIRASAWRDKHTSTQAYVRVPHSGSTLRALFDIPLNDDGAWGCSKVESVGEETFRKSGRTGADSRKDDIANLGQTRGTWCSNLDDRGGAVDVLECGALPCDDRPCLANHLRSRRNGERTRHDIRARIEENDLAPGILRKNSLEME